MISIVVALSTIFLVTLAVFTGYLGPGQERSIGGLEITVDPMAWPQSPETVNFAVIGDAGTGSRDQFRVAKQMAEAYQERPFGLLLTTGDNVYGGSVAERAAEVLEKPYKPLFDAGVEYRATLGNHDVEHHDDLSETLATLGMPDQYYSFTSGPVEFFALDSNSMDDEQLTWLMEELSCSASEWQVAYMHHPLYSSGKHGSDKRLREILEPVLIMGGVDLVLTGHDHNYERTSPQHGIVHVVTGGGSKTRAVGSEEFTAVSHSVLHFLLGKVTENGMELQAIDVDGLVLDSFAVERRSSLTACRE